MITIRFLTGLRPTAELESALGRWQSRLKRLTKFPECLLSHRVMQSSARLQAAPALLRIVPIRALSLAKGDLPLIKARVLSLQPEQLVDVVHRVFHDEFHFGV